MRETESLREYIKLRTEPETLQEHQYYRKLPGEARHRWFYQEFGNYVGFFLALILFTVHHTGAIIFFTLSWLCNKRKLYTTAGKLKKPRHVGTRAHYEELQLVPTKDLRAEVYAVTQITPRDDNYIPCETMDSIEKLIRETSFYSMATSVAKSMQFDQTPVPVEGVLPFNKIGFAGPYGERIVERGRPIRDALPGETTPIIFDIDEIPFSVIGQNGFAGLVELDMRYAILSSIIYIVQCQDFHEFRPFSEEELSKIKTVHDITDEIALRMWNNYIWESNHIPEVHNYSMLHITYNLAARDFTKEIMTIYNATGKIPRQPPNYRPFYFARKFYFNLNATFMEVLSNYIDYTFMLNKTRNRNIHILEMAMDDVIDIFWFTVVLQFRSLKPHPRFYLSSGVHRVLKSMLKRISMMQYKTHKYLEVTRRREGKPNFNLNLDIDDADEVFNIAENYWDVESENTTNICPLTENYICNTNIRVNETVSTPCFCAIVNKDDAKVSLDYFADSVCVSDVELPEHNWITLSINSVVPSKYLLHRDMGPRFVELLVLTLVNVTKLPGHFRSPTLNPVVITRIHCAPSTHTFTIQFTLLTEKYSFETITHDEGLEPNYLLLSPQRFWEEVEAQHTLNDLENIFGVKVAKYGVVKSLSNLTLPNQDMDFIYLEKSDYFQCRLPEVDTRWELLQHVALTTHCPLYHNLFWRHFTVTFTATFGLIFLGVGTMALNCRKYAWMVTFGLMRKFPRLHVTKN
uniref:Uncharacterized protein n=1 Tax=Panagrellus redivivus TaxID=6233 RepID=A0A7E4W5P7_PANRE